MVRSPAAARHFLKAPKDCDHRDKISRGKYLLVNYENYVAASSPVGKPGELLYSSLKTGIPVDVRFEEGSVIDGWLQGLEGVCAGAKIELTIPPELGYVKADDRYTLRVIIDVLEVSDEKIEPPSLFSYIDKNADGLINGDEFRAYFEEVHPGEKAPWGLFVREDKDKDGDLTWEEFLGPKETSPPAAAAAAMVKKAEFAKRRAKGTVEGDDEDSEEFLKSGPVRISVRRWQSLASRGTRLPN